MYKYKYSKRNLGKEYVLYSKEMFNVGDYVLVQKRVNQKENIQTSIVQYSELEVVKINNCEAYMSAPSTRQEEDLAVKLEIPNTFKALFKNDNAFEFDLYSFKHKTENGLYTESKLYAKKVSDGNLSLCEIISMLLSRSKDRILIASSIHTESETKNTSLLKPEIPLKKYINVFSYMFLGNGDYENDESMLKIKILDNTYLYVKHMNVADHLMPIYDYISDFYDESEMKRFVKDYNQEDVRALYDVFFNLRDERLDRLTPTDIVNMVRKVFKEYSVITSDISKVDTPDMLMNDNVIKEGVSIGGAIEIFLENVKKDIGPSGLYKCRFLIVDEQSDVDRTKRPTNISLIDYPYNYLEESKVKYMFTIYVYQEERLVIDENWSRTKFGDYTFLLVDNFYDGNSVSHKPSPPNLAQPQCMPIWEK